MQLIQFHADVTNNDCGRANPDTSAGARTGAHACSGANSSAGPCGR